MTRRTLYPGPKVLRGAILADDHLRGKQPLRTDYSEFESPTIMRRWVEKARASRRKA